MFNPKQYWNERLKNNYSIEGVGDITLGKYNKYLYKIRKYAFKRLLKKLKLNNSNVNIADIGAGTGFYVDLWSKANVNHIFGYDISQHAVKELNNRFNGNKYCFKQLDIGTFEDINTSQFDVISAFDIFYHIVDDNHYKRAFFNINKMLKKDGLFIFSENLIRNKNEYRIPHQVCRTKTNTYKTIKDNGFEIVAKTPMFYLMNTSFYPTNVFQKYTFVLISKVIAKNKKLAGFIGFIFYPLEILAISVLKISRSTEIIICKKMEEK